MGPCMLLKGSTVLIDWLIDWLSERVSERASERASEWASERVSERVSEWVSEWVAKVDWEHTDALHHITPWYLPKWLISFVMLLSTCVTNVLMCPCVCLTIRDECFSACVLGHVPAESTRFLILPGRLFKMPKRKSVLQVQCSGSDLPQ